MTRWHPETELPLAKKVKPRVHTLVECPIGGSWLGPALTAAPAWGLQCSVRHTQRIFARRPSLCLEYRWGGPAVVESRWLHGRAGSMKLAINLPLGYLWQGSVKPSRYAVTPPTRMAAWLGCKFFADTLGWSQLCFAPRGGAVR